MRAAALLGVITLGLTGCSHEAKGSRYILDSGTTGWVKIIYNRPDAPPLPLEDGVTVVRIPQDLKINTRNRMDSNWDHAEFYYQAPDGKLSPLSSKDGDQRQLWGMEKLSDSNGDREVFFVGKEAAFNRAMRVDGARGSDILRSTSGLPDPLKAP